MPRQVCGICSFDGPGSARPPSVTRDGILSPACPQAGQACWARAAIVAICSKTCPRGQQ
ncbi:MAG TPA: hypothetical protein VHS30_32810 [Streptosporangiaceae bacterium]|nr:hypothetical protein [Streptosporangiaceae bacterium]